MLVRWALWGSVMVLLAAVVYVYLTEPLQGEAADPASPPGVVAVTATLSAAPALAVELPTPTATLTPVSETEVASQPIASPPPAIAPGRFQAILHPPSNAVGWVSSGEPGNRFGDRNMHVGYYEGHVYYGAAQFDLISAPAGAEIEHASLELTGLGSENLAASGVWVVRLLDRTVDEDWTSATYDFIHTAPIVSTLAPDLSASNLAAREKNAFTFSPEQLAELQERMETGFISFRIDGPTNGENNIFTWDTGYGDGFGNRPALRISYVPPATPTPVVIVPTPTPENVVTAAALAARATYEATVVGTATPLPFNVVTATPPIIVVNTPTPENAATAQWMAAVATAEAFLHGTATPLPAHVWTATPIPPIPPTATATPIPLLLPIDGVISPASAPAPTPTPAEIPRQLSGKIVFWSDRFGDPAIFAMDPATGQIFQLTDPWAYDRARELNSFAPDGSQRAFVKQHQSTYEIWVQNVADGWTWYLTGSGRATYDPAWSPNAAYIAYVGLVGHTHSDEIFVIDKDSSHEVQLTHTQHVQNRHPTWSPDGAQVVFWSTRAHDRRQIWIMNADGSDQRPLFEDAWNNWDPVWVR